MGTVLPVTEEKRKNLRFHRSLKSLVHYLILPCCGFQAGWQVDGSPASQSHEDKVIATFYQLQRDTGKGGEINLVLEKQSDVNPKLSETHYLLYLEFVKISLAFEDIKWDNSTRISLQCTEVGEEAKRDLLNAQQWTACFDGKKGFAKRKTSPTSLDNEVLKSLHHGTTSMGILNSEHGSVNYKRAPFKQLTCAAGNVTFRMDCPDGFSIFFLSPSLP